MAGNQGNYREKTTRNEKKYNKANGQPRLKEKAAGQKAITYVRMRRNVAAATIRA